MLSQKNLLVCVGLFLAAGLRAGTGCGEACVKASEEAPVSAKVEETQKAVTIVRPAVVKRVAPQVEAPLTAGLGVVRYVVRATILPDGRVSSPEIVDSKAPEFNEAVLAAVSQWKFSPAKIGDTVVATSVDVPVDVDFNRIQERFMARR